ncbi:MAG: chromosomal replication initiation protein DnaA, partial [Thermoleophilia bacterium]|nr:chromosomal replication initiation protein DnaA [Thermoleophilia bacterium]
HAARAHVTGEMADRVVDATLAASVAELDRAELPPVAAQLQHTPSAAPAEGTSSGSGSAMTEAQLLAELAGADVVPSTSLGDGGGQVAAPASTPSLAYASVPSIAQAAPTRPDHEIAGVQRLNDSYRFENFVIGPGNQMVHAAALSVAETPSQSYNPLFIHGSTGLGTTHLLHAIGHYVQETRPEARVAYVTTEQFLARFLQMVQGAKTPAGKDARDRFKAYFRNVDVLLMDDVQFVAGRGEWVQEELFHIFNSLRESGKQIVLTADVGPERIPALEERLRSRFAWGLIADIETPDRETRIAILRKKAQVHGIDVPREVFEEIAARIDTSVRELEGALTRVVAAASFSHEPITTELAHRVLDSFSPAQCEPVTIDRIQNVVCEHYAIDKDDLLSMRRTNSLNLPRHIAMYLSRTLLGTPAKQVALRFNRKDHTTVLHAENKVDDLIRKDQEVHDLVAQLTHAIRGTTGRVGAAR